MINLFMGVTIERLQAIIFINSVLFLATAAFKWEADCAPVLMASLMIGAPANHDHEDFQLID